MISYPTASARPFSSTLSRLAPARSAALLLAAAVAACSGGASNGDPSEESSDALSVVQPGTASGPTKLSVPPKIATLRADPHVIAGYLDVTHYGADPTGVKDSTAAFQSALDDAASNASGSIGATMVVYVPSGTYSISNTITGYQIFNGKNTNLVNAHYGAGNGILAPTLVGPGAGPRPTIVLRDGVFTNAQSPHPMLHMVNTPNAGKGGCGGQWAGSTAVGCFDILFNAAVRDIDFKVGKNAGAIGVQFYSAQMSYMQNVKVDATGGYAGIQGAPATEAWVNIEVDGGEYGVMIDRTAGVSAIAGLTLSNQTIAGVRTAVVGDLSITGFSIHETIPGATGVLTHSPIDQGGMLSMIDGQISTAGAADAAIDNAGNLSVYLNNVYVKAPKVLITNGTVNVPSTGQMQEVNEYAHADPTSNPAGDGYAPGAAIVVDAKKQSADYGPLYGKTATPPVDLVSRNLPGAMPWAFDKNVAWVTDYGADPTGATDSTAAFRRAVAAAHASGSDEVFVPRGNYALSGTVVLNPNTKLFGLPGGFSQLHAPNWNPGGKVAYMIQVGDAAASPAGTHAGKAVVSDISFFLPTTGTAAANAQAQSYLAALDWQTGAGSVSNQVFVGFQYNSGLTVTAPARNLVQVDGGGGRWYGLQIVGDWGPNGAAGYPFLAKNTTAPLSIYGSNIEHADGLSFYGFVNASNVRVLGAKAEDGHAPHWFYLANASNVMISGITNHDPRLDVVVTGTSSNVNVNTTGLYAVTQFTNARITDGAAKYSFADNYALFKQGSFDDGVFAAR
jgi:Pectate lyase superfamily protein